MLKDLFQWLDGHAWSFWAGAVPATFLLLAWIARGIREEASGPATRVVAPWRDALVLFLFLLAWRWPWLLSASEYNPDEGQLLAGAITLTHDPVFWRSVDGVTSGPLNFYVLLPLHGLGLPLDYFTARLTGLLLLWGALFAVHRALAHPFGRAVAWLGVLPAAAGLATASAPDLIHFSTEHLTLLLTGLAAWLLATRQPGDRRRLWLACVVAGTAPWSKLQAAPLTVALAGWALWQAFAEAQAAGRERLKPVAAVGLATAVPTLVAVALIGATGQLETAWVRYFGQNVLYVGMRRSFGVAMRYMYELAGVDGRMTMFLLTVVIILLIALVRGLTRRTRPTALGFAAGGLTLAAVIAVLVPRREFLHYTLLLVVPASLLVGVVIGGWWQGVGTARGRLGLGLVLLVGLGAPPIITRILRGNVPPMYGQFLDHWLHPRSPAGELIRGFATRPEPMAIWGWAPHLYVETKQPQATLIAHIQWELYPGERQDYYLQSFLAAVRRNRPAIFVDATGPGAFAYVDRAASGHETFPALAEEVRRHYRLVYDFISARVYVRNDRLAGGVPDVAQLDAWASRGRFDLPGAVVEPLPRGHFGWRSIYGHHSMLLQTPTQVEWELTGDERQFWMCFGFDPGAYTKGNKTNGAELILELVQDGRERVVWRRMLDPLNQPADRGFQAARVTLPVFAPGARLVLKSDPGPYGDTSWDWVCLGAARFVRNPEPLVQQEGR